MFQGWMSQTPEGRGFRHPQWLKCILELSWRRNGEPHCRCVNQEIRTWGSHLRENGSLRSHICASSQLELNRREEIKCSYQGLHQGIKVGVLALIYLLPTYPMAGNLNSSLGPQGRSLGIRLLLSKGAGLVIQNVL